MEEEILFCQSSLPNMSFLVFEEMRKNGELCDVSLTVHDGAIIAHRVVLAAAIPYFRSLFAKGADNLVEKGTAMTDLEPNALESVIHFAYIGKVHISVRNAHFLLQAADFLQLSEVTEACVKFLSVRIEPYNVLEVCTLAHNINNSKLRESCDYYIQENFGEFVKTKDFLKLPYQCVKDNISRDELNVYHEESVFEAVISWVKYSRPDRKDKLPDLLRDVRLTSFSTGYLTKRVATEKLIRTSSACKELIQDVQNFHLLPENERGSLNLNTAPGRGERREIYAICNSSPCGYSVYRCDFTNHTWLELKSDKSNNDKIFRVVACNEHIYVFLENRIMTFHLKTLEWEMLKPSHGGISGSAALAHGSLIYFFGSHRPSFCNKVCCFDTCQKKWLTESKMENGRAHVAIISVQGTIYVTGGYWKSVWFNAAEKYHISTKKWCQLPPMLVPRSLHGCANIYRKIYVFGGISKYFLCSRGEMYDPLTNLWNTISSMRIRRSQFSCFAHNHKIYAFGGDIEPKLHSTTLQVEIYDAERDRWWRSFDVPEGFIHAVVM